MSKAATLVHPATTSLILGPSDRPDTRTMGGKAAALAALSAADFPVPEWFVLSPAAFEKSTKKTERKALLAGDDEAWSGLGLSTAVLAELDNALDTLSASRDDDALFAVRSSAAEEDSAGHSFAGQFESFLFVPRGNVAEQVVAVWRSAFSQRILSYRTERGLDGPPSPPAVLVQRMIDAESAGVAFSIDPLSGRWAHAVVSAVPGLGEALVGGEADADTFTVDRAGEILDRKVVEKSIVHRLNRKAGSGVSIEKLTPPASRAPALRDNQVQEVADLSRRCQRHFGVPQDIEWAYSSGKLYLLQSRPITTLHALVDPDGVLNIWDNSNIAESYGGITTPLTFSFARYIYTDVYRQFCLLLGVSGKRVADNRSLFQGMLGMVRGRVYYNLLNWYRMLALLPGFSVNHRFMEQMMGVKESLPPEVLQSLQENSMGARFRDGARLLASLARLLKSYLFLSVSIRRFHRRLDAALAHGGDLAELRPDELSDAFHELEKRLLTRWDAPLVNDFFAMIFFGVLRQLAARWCDDETGALQNGLLCGSGDIVSAEPARRMKAMAHIAASDRELCQHLAHGPDHKILQSVRAHPELNQAYEEYIEKFGDRCLDELKLESPTLADNPLLLLRSVGELAQRLGDPEQPTSAGGASDAIRLEAESEVSKNLHGNPIRRLLFRLVLRQARARVRDRENLRFERTRLFGRIRRIFVELGKRFHTYNLLNAPEDIFYLEVYEILGFIEGTATTVNLKDLVEIRRREYDSYRNSPPPADRFDTRGIVHQGNRFEEAAGTGEKPAADKGTGINGLGCCPGKVRGRVRVIHDPREAELKKGEILVAERTDPGWIMLFPLAAGILVERGSLLSHSAIVSREMGIPAVVSIPRLTTILKTGDEVEFDGNAGTVTLLNSATTES